MKILLAADGSNYTQRALDFIVANKQTLDLEGELLVILVQSPLPTGFNLVMGFEESQKLHAAESEDVFRPIRKFLDEHAIASRCLTKIGAVVDEIIDTSKTEQAHLIVMGTHGRDLIGRTIMGSVAQKVVAQSTIPVLLVK